VIVTVVVGSVVVVVAVAAAADVLVGVADIGAVAVPFRLEMWNGFRVVVGFVVADALVRGGGLVAGHVRASRVVAGGLKKRTTGWTTTRTIGATARATGAGTIATCAGMTSAASQPTAAAIAASRAKVARSGLLTATRPTA
jgi:hypothetical protein